MPGPRLAHGIRCDTGQDVDKVNFTSESFFDVMTPPAALHADLVPSLNDNGIDRGIPQQRFERPKAKGLIKYGFDDAAAAPGPPMPAIPPRYVATRVSDHDWSPPRTCIHGLRFAMNGLLAKHRSG